MAKTINYRQVFARKERNEQRIKELCPQARHTSGIYVFFREQDGFRHAYIGLATKSLLTRLAQHLEGYSQHIDLSIRKYGLYESKKNPNGYRIAILCECSPEECNEKEQEYIKAWANEGWQMKNTTGGSQGIGKVDINERKPAKTYTQGVTYGTLKTKKKVKEFFDKYLDYSIKQPPTKIKEKKFAEFKQFLEGNTEGGND